MNGCELGRQMSVARDTILPPESAVSMRASGAGGRGQTPGPRPGLMTTIYEGAEPRAPRKGITDATLPRERRMGLMAREIRGITSSVLKRKGM